MTDNYTYKQSGIEQIEKERYNIDVHTGTITHIKGCTDWQNERLLHGYLKVKICS